MKINEIHITSTYTDAQVQQKLSDFNTMYKRGHLNIEEVSPTNHPSVMVVKDARRFFLLDRNEDSIIGYLSMSYGDSPVVHVAGIKKDFRGSGLMTQLYVAAIHDLGRLYSDNDLSKDAFRFWMSLANKIPVYFYHDKDGIIHKILPGDDIPKQFKKSSDMRFLAKTT